MAGRTDFGLPWKRNASTWCGELVRCSDFADVNAIGLDVLWVECVQEVSGPMCWRRTSRARLDVDDACASDRYDS